MAKKCANGEGNIRKRSDGRWEGRYTAGYNSETGKRIIKNVLGKTQAECKAKLKPMKNSLRRRRRIHRQKKRRPASPKVWERQGGGLFGPLFWQPRSSNHLS